MSARRGVMFVRVCVCVYDLYVHVIVLHDVELVTAAPTHVLFRFSSRRRYGYFVYITMRTPAPPRVDPMIDDRAGA